MKKLVLGLTAAGLLALSPLASAESVIVTDTASWTAVPITVDTTAKTYTVTGTVPTATTTNFYYTYPGYRCLREKRDIVGVDVLVFSAGISGGTDIYCYPET